MAGHFAAAIDLAELLGEVDGIESASIDPAKVSTPGVWVQIVGLTGDRLDDGFTLRTRLHLVVGDNDYLESATALSDLLELVLSLVEPDGEIVSERVLLPTSPAPLPGLAIPVDILAGPTTQE